MAKHAALLPSIQALQQSPHGDTQRQYFEHTLGELAYASFAMKFPALVENIVTYKTLSSDVDAGTALGAFILDLRGEPVYVPAVFTDSALAPLEIMYVKSRNTFVPFTMPWVDDVLRGAQQELGTPTKLPDSVSTDVDIRNLVVPPTTGRYTYASDAQLGADMMKLAGTPYDPVLWQGFVSQFASLNGMTPGVALDQQQYPLEDLLKLFKAHEKAWGGGPQQAPAPEQEQAQVQAPAAEPQMAAYPPATAPAAPKVANVVSPGFFQRSGAHLDTAASKAVQSGALGALIGGGTSVYDGDYSDVGGRMARGAAGGALLGTAGHMMGAHLGSKNPNMSAAADIGQALGTLGGAIGGARPDGLSMQSQPAYDYSYDNYRYAADNGKSLIKHAMESVPDRDLKLLDYLTNAPNRMKRAFQTVLTKNPELMKSAAAVYGVDPLVAALRKHAEAADEPRTSDFGGAQVAVTDNLRETRAFGERAPQAFRGVALRGYYYEDKKPAKNTAVLEQHYRHGQTLTESGVYQFATDDGKTEPAFVLVDPFPVEGYEDDRSRASNTQLSGMTKHPPVSVVFANGTQSSSGLSQDLFHCTYTHSAAEPSVPSALEGSKIYEHIFADKPVAKVRPGYGFWLGRRGAGFVGTEPVHVDRVTETSQGVTQAHCDSGWVVSIDPTAGYARPVRLATQRRVTVPASWTWVPLSSDKPPKVLGSYDEVIATVLGRLERSARKASVQKTGGGQYSIDQEPSTSKAASIAALANRYQISGAEAEAILKIADVDRVCRPWILAKTAGAMEQALSDVLSGLGQQLSDMQGQMQVLQAVQQRAQELTEAQPPRYGDPDDSASAAAPPAPPAGDPAAPAPPAPQAGMPPEAAQGAPAAPPPGMDAPAAPPELQSMDPSMQQPPMPEPPPPPPIMNVETPTSDEIAAQINPAFLQDAARLQQNNVFDVGALSELQHAAARTGDPESRGLGENNKDLEETVDDLGRTLLTMQLRRGELEKQMSPDTYHDLEDQVRNTFKGLGKLMLDIRQHTTALTHAQDAGV